MWPIWPRSVKQDLDPLVQPYKDILDGLAVLYEDPFINDIRDTVLAFPESRIGVALNKKQTACKKWLVEALYKTLGAEIGQVHVLAGWYGLLGAILLNDPRFHINRLVNIDLDPSCEEVALSLNATQVEQGRFYFRAANIYDLDYSMPSPELGAPDLIINTSCEHLDRFDAWFSQLPDGVMLALQSNDYWDIPEHVNCVENLEAFKAQAPLNELLFSGELVLDKYTRFMLIGRK